jgi:hypothetical protein
LSPVITGTFEGKLNFFNSRAVWRLLPVVAMAHLNPDLCQMSQELLGSGQNFNATDAFSAIDVVSFQDDQWRCFCGVAEFP